ncbi:DUF2169 domain-containing protein [Archangium violaceum]|uniref:DUF2169 domain-containing protein n=1 Tax=Archangium violaceum TaxID=83451 RepID=UPI001EF0C452|nr:DUF2169 domain-containing protein [Archangium violaceum]
MVLIGHTYPQQKGATETLVALQVGPLKKAVRAVGERTWFRSMGSVAATKPRPFDKLPLTRERAFGGCDRTDPAKPAFEPLNPVGTGFRASPRHFFETTSSSGFPPASFGETGAATGAASVCLAVRGFSRNYAGSRAAMVLLLGDDEERGAVLVEDLLPSSGQER